MCSSEKCLVVMEFIMRPHLRRPFHSCHNKDNILIINLLITNIICTMIICFLVVPPITAYLAGVDFYPDCVTMMPGRLVRMIMMIVALWATYYNHSFCLPRQQCSYSLHPIIWKLCKSNINDGFELNTQ